MTAALFRCPEAVKMLVEEGKANIHAQSKDGSGPIHYVRYLQA